MSLCFLETNFTQQRSTKINTLQDLTAKEDLLDPSSASVAEGQTSADDLPAGQFATVAALFHPVGGRAVDVTSDSGSVGLDSQRGEDEKDVCEGELHSWGWGLNSGELLGYSAYCSRLICGVRLLNMVGFQGEQSLSFSSSKWFTIQRWTFDSMGRCLSQYYRHEHLKLEGYIGGYQFNSTNSVSAWGSSGDMFIGIQRRIHERQSTNDGASKCVASKFMEQFTSHLSVILAFSLKKIGTEEYIILRPYSLRILTGRIKTIEWMDKFSHL
ncbi:hypothetical protein FB451DRAFT_1529483 [Mycena latifolia]|nr:hypothetical protein FB451DRAFT_1529483 [Mycena latifolia]